MLIAPGAIAHLLAEKFEIMVFLALIISSCCSIAGVYVSFFIDSAPAPTIIVLLTISFIGVFIYQNVKSRHASTLLTTDEF
jgi:manganese/iron transport system permease protein